MWIINPRRFAKYLNTSTGKEIIMHHYEDDLETFTDEHEHTWVRIGITSRAVNSGQDAIACMETYSTGSKDL